MENPCHYQENTKNVETMVQQSYIWPETFNKEKRFQWTQTFKIYKVLRPL